MEEEGWGVVDELILTNDMSNGMGYEISMLLTATFKSAIRIDHNILQANVQSAVNFLKRLILHPSSGITFGDIWAFAQAAAAFKNLDPISSVEMWRTDVLGLLEKDEVKKDEANVDDQLLAMSDDIKKQRDRVLAYKPLGAVNNAFHEFAKQHGLLTPFWLLNLVQELQDMIYEKMMPVGKKFELGRYCRLHKFPIRPIPSITQTYREVRGLLLPDLYLKNTFHFHALRYNFDPLIAHCRAVRSMSDDIPATPN
ncbi:hypothetical protein LTR56_002036 [Elasticomyces elasticus]|nr:hypothetical protein LTR22_012178 [Elasticomyces elasticus]KAK3658179.1 hypothetical protein LTR56_002036 [Elasticomyces elasticus]KAK4919458.1 hypothetical protein LTR49_012836 [Elasticomyces elasticus]KAK5764064.1 hypothetical protein LTS12_005758 [Elasticomyces elasticus]